ncbi:hypothetical protein AVEN_264714-1 [Araneus ventricosus]|uniref:Uncharacterized protein n=1 Tax=Araneus ventricosus TaxID=182803 RepID=A0A4Y2IDL9_ARAVE|nr:hypothetical protein AVEN_264714-1 [Araneus ventricosus]
MAYSCYCLIRKHEFRNKPFSLGQTRTKERYDWSCVNILGNSQQLDPVCTVFVEKVPLELTIPLNDGCPAYLVFIILKKFPPFREIFKK